MSNINLARQRALVTRIIQNEPSAASGWLAWSKRLRKAVDKYIQAKRLVVE